MLDMNEQVNNHFDFPRNHVNWMYRDNQKEWQPFLRCDSEKIEDAWVQYTNGGKVESFLVDQSRYQINISTRTMDPVYWKKESQDICRATWMYQTDKDKFIPLEEEESKILELSWIELLDICKGKFKPVSSIAIKDLINDFEDEISTTKKANKEINVSFHTCERVMNKYRGYSKPSIKYVVRGHSNLPKTIKDDCHSSPLHLVFVVHGIGEYFCSKKDSNLATIVDSSQALRASSSEIYPEMKGYIEYLPIQWTDSIRNGEEQKLLHDVSIPSIQFVRSLVNEVVSDVLFYMHMMLKAQQSTILNHVAMTLNSCYKLFKEHHPKFNGSVCIMGHSLGSVISFDLLSHQNPASGVVHTIQQLDFNCDAFFAFGSPIGLFHAIQGNRLGKQKKLLTCPQIYNIYHPSDPVAYRMEPLIDSSLKELNAVRIETFEGSDKLHYVISDLGTQISEGSKDIVQNVNKFMKSLPFKTSPLNQEKARVEKNLDANLKQENEYGDLNQGKRLDYELQSTPFEHLNPFASALWAHSCYWQSKDFTLFIVKMLMSIPNKQEQIQ